MKKLVSVLVTLLMVVGLTTQAMAAFESENVLLTIYNPIDNEVGIDLGAIGTLTGGQQELAEAGTFGLGDFGVNVSGWSDLSVGVYTSFTTQTDAVMAFATTEQTVPTVNYVAWNPFYSGSTGMHSTYASIDVDEDGKAIQAANGLLGYDYVLNKQRTLPGAMAGFHSDNMVTANANLGDLATVGYVDLYLYEFSLVGQSVVPGPDADYKGVIRLDADGSVTFNPVPIPGALILFASGLVGLIGIRRKNA